MCNMNMFPVLAHFHDSCTCAGREVEQLWQEYESASSPEAMLVKDFDKVCMCCFPQRFTSCFCMSETGTKWLTDTDACAQLEMILQASGLSPLKLMRMTMASRRMSMSMRLSLHRRVSTNLYRAYSWRSSLPRRGISGGQKRAGSGQQRLLGDGTWQSHATPWTGRCNIARLGGACIEGTAGVHGSMLT